MSDRRRFSSSEPLTTPTPDDGRLWAVTVTVPADLDEGDRDDLFDLVADAAHRWEPDDRDGWDIDVSGGPVTPRVCATCNDTRIKPWKLLTDNEVVAALRAICDRTGPSIPCPDCTEDTNHADTATEGAPDA